MATKKPKTQTKIIMISDIAQDNKILLCNSHNVSDGFLKLKKATNIADGSFTEEVWFSLGLIKILMIEPTNNSLL